MRRKILGTVVPVRVDAVHGQHFRVLVKDSGETATYVTVYSARKQYCYDCKGYACRHIDHVLAKLQRASA